MRWPPEIELTKRDFERIDEVAPIGVATDDRYTYMSTVNLCGRGERGFAVRRLAAAGKTIARAVGRSASSQT